MTLQEHFARAQARSVALYLQRQEVEQRRQQAVLEGQQIDLALVKLDGELELLEALLAEAIN